MKIRRFAALLFFCAALLRAQELLDADIYGVALNDKYIAAVSRSGVSWRTLPIDKNNVWRSETAVSFVKDSVSYYEIGDENVLIAVKDGMIKLVGRDERPEFPDIDSILAKYGDLFNLIKGKVGNLSPNITLNYAAAYGESIAFATTDGIIYSADGVKFEYFHKTVDIKKGLKEVYAEPGILNYLYKYCTFEYSLSEKDNVTIDILNYNLDFVCRIIENELRPAADGGGRSTDRTRDKWDGTVNNNGGKSAPAGVYYFKITTLKGHRAIGKVIVAR